MITFKQYITELFDKPYPTTASSASVDSKLMATSPVENLIPEFLDVEHRKFTLDDGRKGLVALFHYTTYKDKKKAQLSFNTSSKLPDKDSKIRAVEIHFAISTDSPDAIEVDGVKMTDDNTGEGDAMRIFATVVESGKKFIKKTKPDEVRIYGKKTDKKKAKIYGILAKKFAGSIGYKYIKRVTVSKHYYVGHILEKK